MVPGNCLDDPAIELSGPRSMPSGFRGPNVPDQPTIDPSLIHAANSGNAGVGQPEGLQILPDPSWQGQRPLAEMSYMASDASSALGSNHDMRELAYPSTNTAEHHDRGVKILQSVPWSRL